MPRFLQPVRQAGDWLGGEVRRVMRGCLDLAAPPICCRCQTPLASDGWSHQPVLLCDACVSEVCPKIESTCPRCAAPAATSSLNEAGCWRCKDAKFPFASVTALGVYQNELRDAVLVAKSTQGLFLGNALGGLLARKVIATHPSGHDFITATPMHWLRKWRRGINAAEVVAEAIAAATSARCKPLVACQRWVERQSSLPPSKRPKNVRAAYHLRQTNAVRNRSVLLVDDILTTGATAAAITRQLQKAGAARVDVAVLARGIGWA